MKLEVIRVMDDEGRVVHPEREPKLTGDELRRLFRAMTLQRVLDERMMMIQRTGGIGFYLTCTGEEAVPYGAAHALRTSDWILTAYRETGAALYRGYPLRTFMCQMFGNAEIKKGTDDVRGDYISYDAVTEYYQVVGGGKIVGTPGNPEGRVRAVIQPKNKMDKLDKPFNKSDKPAKTDKPGKADNPGGPQANANPAVPLKTAPGLSNPPPQ